MTPEVARGASNLTMRVVAALVLAPLTIAIAWVGGWLWLLLVMAAAGLLYFEWLMIVGASRNLPIAGVGLAALVAAGLLLAVGKPDLTLGFLAAGLVLLALLAREQRWWTSSGLAYAAAALVAAVLVRADLDMGIHRADVRFPRGLGHGHRRLFRRAWHRRAEALAAR